MVFLILLLTGKLEGESVLRRWVIREEDNILERKAPAQSWRGEKELSLNWELLGMEVPGPGNSPAADRDTVKISKGKIMSLTASQIKSPNWLQENSNILWSNACFSRWRLDIDFGHQRTFVQRRILVSRLLTGGGSLREKEQS